MGGSTLVNSFDIFSQPVHFSFRKNTYFKTTCGGIITLIEAIVLLLYLYYLIDEMISRKIPIIIDSQIIYDKPQLINFIKDPNYENPDVVFLYQDDTNIFYNSFGIKKNISPPKYLIFDTDTIQYLYMEIQQVSVKNKNFSRKDLNFKICERFANFKEDFLNLNLNQTYCFMDDYRIVGNMNTEDSEYVEIRLRKCNENFANNKNIVCKSEKEINDFVKDIQVEWYYDNEIFNMTNVDDITANSLEQKYWDILGNFTKISKVPVGRDIARVYNSYIPDFLYASYFTDSALSLKEFNTEITDIDTELNLLKIQLVGSEYQTTYERRYIDIFTQLATLGGMCDVIYLIGFIFVWHISHEKFNEAMVKTFYNISNPDTPLEEKNGFEKLIRETYNDKNIQKFERYYEEIIKKNTSLNENGFNNAISSGREYQDVNLLIRDENKNTRIDKNWIDDSDKFFDNFEKVNEDKKDIYKNFFTIHKIESMFNTPTGMDKLNAIFELIKKKIEKIKRSISSSVDDNKKNDNLNTEKEKIYELKEKDHRNDKNKFLQRFSIYEHQFLSKQRKSNDEDEEEVKNLLSKDKKKLEVELREILVCLIYDYNNFEDEVKKIKLEPIDYFKILENSEQTDNFLKYKILYDALRFNKDKMHLTRLEFTRYFFDCSSYEIDNNYDIKKFENKKKLLLYHIAKEKLKIDCDIVNILKTIDQFNDFKDVIMDEDQSKLFDYAIKKISDKKFEEKDNNENNEDLDELVMKSTEEGLNEIFDECRISGPSYKHINLLSAIGINKEIIKEFENIKNSNYGKPIEKPLEENKNQKNSENANNIMVKNPIKKDANFEQGKVYDKIMTKFGDN